MNRFYREFIVLLLVATGVSVLSAETRKVVAVVDTGLPYNNKIIPYLCKDLQFDVTGYGIEDYHGHGTNIIGLIAKTLNPKTHCISMIKWYHTANDKVSSKVLNERVVKFSEILIKAHPSIVNLSLDGDNFVQEELNAYKLLLSRGTHIVVAAGNSGKNLDTSCDTYPACYGILNRRFHVVGALGAKYSNFGGPITEVLPGSYQCGMFGTCMSGTSQAAANLSAKLVEETN